MTHTLILGGARSGKSALAEQLARESGRRVVVIATASALDAEMAERIARHRADRPADWITVEEPIALGEAILRHAAADTLVLVDCLTLWLTNVLFGDCADLPEQGVFPLPAVFERERLALLQALEQATGEVVLVSNEVGLGIVPLGAINRIFVDEAGRLNQAVAKVCGKVVFVAAGLPLVLKGA
ncbi:bifunctional adenosylcobinamide kinase/adenosylcobinamide-phosphate guanylyltransferase [Andreprevotia chitinilytica]|uniref:bifunctional adenosylcobinamide kinase/adenosylcobinamide-phosphate guanylyltransferase n=1 Tax=Andreprevotia chitinilytica TaxID=396808 RepID=UPI000557FF00|nr:bifunctional adenosylcobinamide kinase/adenosylcobinamide-phosphate guanylyltransferase [Andreprevotia chitinilytica]